jgi:hypothetical protein
VGLTAVDLVEVILEVLAEHGPIRRREVLRRERELGAAIALTANGADVSSAEEDPQLHVSPPRRSTPRWTADPAW